MSAPVDIEALRKLAEAATKGPWEVVTPWPDMPQYTRLSAIHGPPHVNAHDDYSVADTAFIASARTAVPALLDEVERLRAKLESADAYKANLLAENADLRAKLAVFQADHEAAAGELRVPLESAHPGSTIAKLLSANSIMRQERAKLAHCEAENADLRLALDRNAADLQHEVFARVAAESGAAALRSGLQVVENMGHAGYSEQGCPLCLLRREHGYDPVRAPRVHLPGCQIGEALKVDAGRDYVPRADLDAARARGAELEAALLPFVRQIDALDEVHQAPDQARAFLDLTYADFRRARAALAAAPGAR